MNKLQFLCIEYPAAAKAVESTLITSALKQTIWWCMFEKHCKNYCFLISTGCKSTPEWDRKRIHIVQFNSRIKFQIKDGDLYAPVMWNGDLITQKKHLDACGEWIIYRYFIFGIKQYHSTWYIINIMSCGSNCHWSQTTCTRIFNTIEYEIKKRTTFSNSMDCIRWSYVVSCMMRLCRKYIDLTAL